MTSGPVWDAWRDWRQLVARSGEQQVRAWQAVADTAGGLLSGRTRAADARRAYWHLARREGARYLRELAELGIGYTTAVAELNRGVAERFVAEFSAPSAGRAPGDVLPRRVEVPLRGPVGGKATTTFTVANPHASSATVRFIPGRMAGVGVEPFDPPLSFAPSTLRLAPGEERAVTLTLPLSKQQFDAERSYTATVTVTGSEPLELHLTLTVEPAGGQA